LIGQRLDMLKKSIKKGFRDHQTIIAIPPEVKKDKTLDTVTATLSKSEKIEQAYLFHQAEYGEKSIYYLLLIGSGLGNEKLGSLTQSLKSQTADNIDFVLIGHERYWIQKHLFQYQHFFARLVREENL